MNLIFKSARRLQVMRAVASVLVLGFFAVAMKSHATTITVQADIVVYGGSFSAPAAALAASRTATTATVLLVEPTDWLGGQGTSQGVSAIDNAWHSPVAALMRDNQTTYYPTDYLSFLQQMRDKPTTAPGTGYGPNGTNWVSRDAYDPRTGAWVLNNMVAARPNITTYFQTVVKSVETTAGVDAYGSGRNITALNMIQRTAAGGYTSFSNFTSAEIPDWYSSTNSTSFTKQIIRVVPANPGRGLVVIDASETGDAMLLSGATYTVGREVSTEEFTEAGAMPAYFENAAQATVYPFCMTSAASPATENLLKGAWPDFTTYYNTQNSSFFSLGSYSWAQVWTYRRLLNTGTLFGTTNPNVGDVSMQNWNPGNDYPYGSIYKTKSQAAAEEASNWMGGLDLVQLAAAEKHAVAWYFWMKANKTTSWDTKFLYGADTLNMMGTGHGLSKFPYIRCARRLVGPENFRIRQRELAPATGGNSRPTSFRYYDSVGIGAYALDVHPQTGTTGIGPELSYPAPFYIPLRSLTSDNVRNLLASGKNMAQTFWVNSCYRLHPIEWQSGSGAGTAAAVIWARSLNNRNVYTIPNIRDIQNLTRTNAPIHWQAHDGSTAIPPRDGDLIVNNTKTITNAVPFRVEGYHPTASRARFYLNGTIQTTVTARINGRFLWPSLTLLGGNWDIEVRFDDASNTEIGTIIQTFNVGGPVTPGLIVDDADGSPGYTSTGTWVNATAQANKYATTYKYATGTGSNTNAPTATATFKPSFGSRGSYEISTWYPEASNRANNSPFTIFHALGSTTVRINQQINGGQWVSLGTYNFAADGTERIVLGNNVADGTKLVLSDAVRAVRVGNFAEVQDWNAYTDSSKP